jgi:anaerobic magnesium-protoporphyrin IX monomethyl ester cyclase
MNGDGKPILIVAPRFTDLARFGGASVEAKLQVMTNRDVPASLTNLDTIVNSPLKNPPLGRGLQGAGPMAAYYLESFFKRRGYRASAFVAWDGRAALERAMRADPLAVLLSTTFITEPDVLVACLEELAKVAGATPIVVGGPFVYKQSRLLRRGGARRDLALAEFEVDARDHHLFGERRDPALDGCVFVADPQGERTALIVLERLARGARSASDLADVPNLVLGRDQGGWTATARAPEPVDLDAEGTRWDLVDEVPAVVPIRTAVGCDGTCRFCGFRTVHPHLRLRSVASVVAEMELAVGRGGAFVNFVDDDIFVASGRGRSLAEGIDRAGLSVVWGGFLRPDRVTEDDARICTAAGLKFAIAGMESGSPGQLERMGKRMDPRAAIRGVEALVACGAGLDLTFIVGFPGETAQTMDDTAALLNGLPLGGRGCAHFELYPFNLVPGTEADTPLFRRKYGLRGRGASWAHDTMTSRDVVETHIPRLFMGVGSVPYYHGDVDAPSWWAPERRDRAFGHRAALTHGLLSRLDDVEIQARFARLFLDVAEERRAGAPPHWREVLADRGEQPGGTPQ